MPEVTALFHFCFHHVFTSDENFELFAFAMQPDAQTWQAASKQQERRGPRDPRGSAAPHSYIVEANTRWLTDLV